MIELSHDGLALIVAISGGFSYWIGYTLGHYQGTINERKKKGGAA